MDNLPLGFGTICGGFFFLITSVGGVVLLLFSRKSKKKAGASQNWPGIPGVVHVSEVRESASTDDDGHTRIAYYPHIEYSYSIIGQTYTSKQIAFGGVQGFNNPGQAQAILGKYRVNSPVQVYYNPQNPAEAVLERVAGGGAKTAQVIGIILIVISILIACPLVIGLIRNF